MKEKIEKALLTVNGAKVKVEESQKSKENKHKKFFLKTLNFLPQNLLRLLEPLSPLF